MSEERIIDTSKGVTTTTKIGVIGIDKTNSPIKELNDTMRENFRVINTALLSELEQSRKTIKSYEVLSRAQMDREAIKAKTITRLTETNEHLGDNLATVVAEKENVEAELNACSTELMHTRMALQDMQVALKESRCYADNCNAKQRVTRQKLNIVQRNLTNSNALNIMLAVSLILVVIAAYVR